LFVFQRSTATLRVAARHASTRHARRLAGRGAVLAASIVLATACTTLPNAGSLDRPVTHALAAPETTPLGQALAPLQSAHPGQSGFRLLTDGTEALQMRVLLARAATKTLDLQYYVAAEDTTGKLLLAAALLAADHGVRVRLLVDGLNFKDSERVMAALDMHPAIEVRVFNPFGSASSDFFTRTTNLFAKIDRFTRRMHNKAMIADNEVAIVGGRNLGDEYFSASPTVQFRDVDALVAGPVVSDISASFDTFWNSAESYPLNALKKHAFAEQDLNTIREALRAYWRGNADAYGAKPADPTSLATRIGEAQLPLVWAPAEFDFDSPIKVAAPTEAYTSPPMQRLVELVRGAQHEVLIVSPYFVPHDAGVRALGELTRRGVRVAVLTNSMASTDNIAVQAGYSPYRIPLLENGVELHEYRPQRGDHEDEDEDEDEHEGTRSRASLHAKVYVIDRSTLVIGSMNLDPRSAHLNTELVLVIHSRQLADQVAALFDRAASPGSSYRVRVATPAETARLRAIGAPVSGLVWTGEEQGENGPYMASWSLDPYAGLVRNLLTGLFLLLPVGSQL
jgi:putative cardiolipin synthase